MHKSVHIILSFTSLVFGQSSSISYTYHSNNDLVLIRCPPIIRTSVGWSLTWLQGKNRSNINQNTSIFAQFSRTKAAAGSQISIWRCNLIIKINYRLICRCLYVYRNVLYKSGSAFGQWSEWHYSTRGLVYRYIITRPGGQVIIYPSTNLPRCGMPFRSQAYACSLWRVSLYYWGELSRKFQVRQFRCP